MTRADTLHFTRDLPPATKGGLSTAVHALALAQAAAGRRVAVLSFDAWRPRARATANPSAPPVPVDQGPLHVLRVSTPADLPAAEAFARAVAPARLHVHDALLWPVAAAVRADLGAPAALTLHVLHAAQNAARGLTVPTLGLAAEDAAVAAADLLVAPSRAVADLVAARAPTAAARLHVVPLGLPQRPALPALDRAGGPVVFAGRFDAIKGLPELFTAVVSLLTRHPGAHAVLAGGLPDNPRADRRWRRRWLAEAPAHVASRVALPGWLDAPAVAELHRRASVVLVPSRFETFGLAALEAMSEAAPIVAFDVGGLRELLAGAARVVPAGDVPGLVAAASELMTDAPAAAALGARAEGRSRDFTAARAARALERAWSAYSGARAT